MLAHKANSSGGEVYLWRPWFPSGVLSRAIRQYIVTTKPNGLIEEIEGMLERYLGANYVIFMPSGTTAITAVLQALLPPNKDEVILPSFVCKNVPFAVQAAGKNLIFAEAKWDTFNLDEDDIKEKIAERTGAVVAVHLFGTPCNIEGIKAIAKEKGVLLIEDAAQAFGASYEGEKTSTIGDVGILSFNNKVIDACGGGAVVTNSKEIYEKVKNYRDSHFSVTRKGYFKNLIRCWLVSQHPRLAKAIADRLPQKTSINLPTRLCVSTLVLLRSILPVIDVITSRRQENFKLYDEYLQSLYIEKPHYDMMVEPACTFYTIRLKPSSLARRRDEIQSALDNRGVHTRVVARATHNLYGSVADLCVTDELTQCTFSLPTDPHLGEEEIAYVSMAVNEVVDSFALTEGLS